MSTLDVVGKTVAKLEREFDGDGTMRIVFTDKSALELYVDYNSHTEEFIMEFSFIPSHER